MKKIITTALLLFFAVGLTACVAKQELMIDINKTQIEEAWEVAYERGVSMNYTPQQLDVKRWIVHLYQIEPNDDTKKHIRMEIVTEEKVKNNEVDADKFKGMRLPVLHFVGSDEDIAADDIQVLADINKIASFVMRCCAVESKTEIKEKEAE